MSTLKVDEYRNKKPPIGAAVFLYFASGFGDSGSGGTVKGQGCRASAAIAIAARMWVTVAVVRSVGNGIRFGNALPMWHVPLFRGDDAAMVAYFARMF